MFTVAIIGPDGAGKSTMARRLVHDLPLPVKYVYMGINLENSTLVLPTTRLFLEIKRWRGGRPDMVGAPDTARHWVPSRNPLKRALTTLKLSVRLANLAAEEWFHQAVVWYYQRRGNIVIFDRHFFIDHYAHDIARGDRIPFPHRMHGLMLKHFYPRPDLVIYLDAAAEVLFARKGDSSLEYLERRRQEYLQLRDVLPAFHIVDAALSGDEVARQICSIVLDFYARRSDPSVSRGHSHDTNISGD